MVGAFGTKFEEVGLGVSLTSPDENLEIFLPGNVRSGDQTDGNNVTIELVNRRSAAPLRDFSA